MIGLISGSPDPFVNCRGVCAYRFDKRPGAVLTMRGVSMTEIPHPETHLLETLRSPELEKKVVVTQAYACSAYHLLLNNSKVAVEVTLGLKIAGAVSGTGGEVGGEVGAGWICQGSASYLRDGGRDGGPRIYCPLYTLKCLKRARDVPADPLRSDITGDSVDKIVNFVPPWGVLDSEGNEI
jgi:hypothetical protein